MRKYVFGRFQPYHGLPMVSLRLRHANWVHRECKLGH